MSQTQFDAAVVGTGPNGLAAAIVLAKAGHRVIVYEGQSHVGGSAQTRPLEEPDCIHDICSAIQPMGYASPFFKSLALEQKGLSWIQPEIPLAHPLDHGEAVFLFRDLDQTTAQFEEDARAYKNLFGPLVDGFEPLLKDALGPLGLPTHPLAMARFGLNAIRSCTAVAGRFKSVKARALLAGLCAHSVLPLELAPSAAIGLMLGAAGHAVGWPMPKGGAQAITDALVAMFKEEGGVIQTDTPITDLSQVDTKGPVLLQVAPKGLLQIAGEVLSTGERAALQKYRYGPGVCKVDWTMDGPIPWEHPDVQKAGTVHLGGTLEELATGERDAFEGRSTPKPYVLLAQPSQFDDTRAPAGKHVAWAYCHVPHGSDEDATAQIEAQVERYAPGFCDQIRTRHVKTAAHMERMNPTFVGGDINGGAPILSQLFTRPLMRLNPYATSHPRIFLCSSSTPPGGGVHGMAGYYAAKSALKRMPG